MNLREEVAKINWFHSIDLGGGVVTPGSVDPHLTLERIGLPEDLRGLTVIDIGANNGFYSFEAERRGAKVLAIDSYCWRDDNIWGQAGFNLARRALDSKVDDMFIDVYDLCPERVGTFDLVLFLGVLYHLRHPLLALERVLSITGNQLILETHVDMLSTKHPAMRFYPGKDLVNDPTNWWGPNPPAVVAMLKDVGFREVKVFPVHRLMFRLRNAIYHIRDYPLIQTINQDRVVFHAWR